VNATDAVDVDWQGYKRANHYLLLSFAASRNSASLAETWTSGPSAEPEDKREVMAT
ncbi:unnamed protein product, partial [Symbiodinium sp. CCMP2592]